MNDDETSDPVDRAFELLRGVRGPATLDPRLEARLRERFDARRRGLRRFLVPSVAVVALSGAGLAATGGVQWLRSWWFEVDVEGGVHSETVEGEGRRELRFRTADGAAGTVEVQRERLPGDGVRTSIRIDRSSPGREESEQAEDVAGGSPPARYVPASMLDGATHLASGTDRAGQAYELYASSDDEEGTRLLVLRSGRAPMKAVEEIARVPFDLAARSVETEVTQHTDGRLELTVRKGTHAELTFLWGGGVLAEPGVSELATPDGKVRVRVEDEPR